MLSVLRYSLHSVGLPPQGATTVTQAIHRQLRLIARSPAHLWHVTSNDILLRVQVPNPWHTLCKQFQALPTGLLYFSALLGITDWLIRL